MSSLDWSSSGVGVLSVVIAALLYLAFRKRVFGVLDPMIFFLVTRVAPLLAVIVLMVSLQALTSTFFWLMVASTVIFIGSLWASTPRIKHRPVPCDDGVLRGLLQAAVGLILLKLAILLTSSGPLPIFGGHGSDSYINFDLKNKVGSSLLLAIGSTEVILLSFVIPLAKGKMRFVSMLLLTLAALLGLASGKKSSLILFLLSFALGEYLRIYYVQSQHRYFLKPTLLVMFGLGAVGWAGWIYSRTGGDISGFELDSLMSLLDLIFIQWSYPFFLFASGELSSFFDTYEVNRLIYFFHTILSPLGFPAFSASIGPALHEFQTGELTGQGTNSTFILEGYALFGILMPLYAAALAFIIGRIRSYLLLLTSLRKKVLYSALFLPTIYVAPVDALLFMKMVYGLILLLPLLYLLTWTTKYVR